MSLPTLALPLLAVISGLRVVGSMSGLRVVGSMSGLRVVGSMSGLRVVGSPRFDAAVRLRSEVAAGSTPRRPRAEAEATLAVELRPGVAVQLTTLRSALRLELDSRIYYRTPNLAGVDKPLLMEVANLIHGYSFSERTRWDARAGAVYGSIDYTNSQVAFQQAPTARALTPTLSVFTANGEARITHALRAEERLYAGLVAETTRALGNSTLPSTYAAGGDLSYTDNLDAKSSLGVELLGRYYRLGEALTTRSATAGVRMERRFATSSSVQAVCGLTLMKVTGAHASVYPYGSLAVSQAVYRRRAFQFLNRNTVFVRTSLDPIRARVLPVVGAETMLQADFSDEWSVVMLGGFYTIATATESAPDALDTYISAQIRALRRLSPRAALEFGARYVTGAPHVSESFHVIDRQVWVFAALSLSYDSAQVDARPSY